MYWDNYSDVNFLVGVNGSGKSRYLKEIARQYSYSENYNVVAISNTIFDKFNIRGLNKLTANHGRYIVRDIIVDGLIRNEIDGEDFFNILDYLNFDKIIYVNFDFGKDFNFKSLDEIFYKKIDFDSPLIRGIKDFDFIIKIMNDFSYFDRDHGYVMKLDKSNLNFDNSSFAISIVLKFLRDAKICKIKVLLSKNKNKFNFIDASSGESHFLINIIFLYNNLNRNLKNIVLIDEPEISLHPKWQREYVLKLYDYFYKYNCQFFLATHSPLVISKVKTSKNDLYQDYIQKLRYKIFNVKNEKINEIQEDEDYSVESLYWDVFEILTPDNSFLSRYCVKLLDEMQEGKKSFNYVENEFKRMIANADNKVQKQVLIDIKEKFLSSRGKYDL